MSNLETLAADLLKSARSRSDLSVLYATPNSKLGPTPPDVLDKIEQEIDAPLPSEIRRFYAGTSGLLGLVFQQGKAKGPETKDQPEDWSALCDTDGDFWREAIRPLWATENPCGMICIPSAAEVFRKGYWLDRIVPEPSDDEIEIDGKTFSDEAVYNDLYPFDFIGTFYCAALWLNRKSREWRVLLGEDHGASWTDFKTMSVAEYFAELERSLGGARKFFSTNTDDWKEFWAVR